MREWTDAIREKILSDKHKLPDNTIDSILEIIATRKRRRATQWICASSGAIALSLIIYYYNSSVIIKPSVTAFQETVKTLKQDSLHEDYLKDEEKSFIPKENRIVNILSDNLDDDKDIFDSTNETLNSETITLLSLQDSTRVDRFSSEPVHFSSNESFTHSFESEKMKRLSISVYSNESVFRSMQSNNSSLALISGPEHVYKHYQPKTIGVSFNYKLSNRYFLSSGLEYSLCYSTVSGQGIENTYSQSVHFLGIPLSLNWIAFQQSDFFLYAGLGGKIQSNIYNIINNDNVYDGIVLYSFVGLLGIMYKPFKTFGIYFEPQYNYSLLQNKEYLTKTYYTEYPSALNLKVGISFDF